MAARFTLDGIRRAAAHAGDLGRLHPTTAAGIAAAATVCAVGWYTAGTRPDAVAGGCVLCGGWLVLAVTALRPWDHTDPAGAAGGSRSERTRGPGEGSPGLPGSGDRGSGDRGSGPRRAGRRVVAERAGRRAPGGAWGVPDPVSGTVCLAAEALVYAGLVVGAPAAEQSQVWRLAIAALVLLTVRHTLPRLHPAAGRGRAHAARPGRPEAVRGALGRWLRALLGFPLALRFALIAVVTPVSGARAAFLALLACGAVALAADLLMSLWACVRSGPGESAGPGRQQGHGGEAAASSGPGRVAPSIAAARGDGLLARAAGRLTRGQIAPLPPALVGALSTTLLAVVGMSALPGPILLAPLAVMSLAAAGAGHPHDGRFDWLTPPTLRLGEFAYVAGLGLGAAVPSPLIFAFLCALGSMHLAAGKPVAGKPGPGAPALRPSGDAWWAPLGWEGRMLVLALSVLAGFAVFAYLAMTAYLGLLVARAALAGWGRAVQPHVLAGPEGEGE